MLRRPRAGLLLCPRKMILSWETRTHATPGGRWEEIDVRRVSGSDPESPPGQAPPPARSQVTPAPTSVAAKGGVRKGVSSPGVPTPPRASASAAPPLPSAGLPLARPARAGSEPRAARRADSLEAGAARGGAGDAGGGAEPGTPARSPPGPDRAAGVAGSTAPSQRWGEMPAPRGTPGAARTPRCCCQGPAA